MDSKDGGEYFSNSTTACAEKIILCVDVSNEMNGYEFDKSERVTRMDLIKQSIVMFVQQKAQMNADHQFGICLLSRGTILSC